MKTIAGVKFEGKFGWARHVTVPGHVNSQVNAATWIMRLPKQTIGCDYFILMVGSLEEREGVPAPKLHYPGAEYELLLMSLHPDHDPRVEESDSWVPMEPYNVCVQFHGLDRAQAGRVAAAVAEACTLGRLPAETQMYVTPFEGKPKMMYIKELLDMWKSAVAQLVEHERTGGLHGRVN